MVISPNGKGGISQQAELHKVKVYPCVCCTVHSTSKWSVQGLWTKTPGKRGGKEMLSREDTHTKPSKP